MYIMVYSPEGAEAAQFHLSLSHLFPLCLFSCSDFLGLTLVFKFECIPGSPFQ